MPQCDVEVAAEVIPDVCRHRAEVGRSRLLAQTLSQEGSVCSNSYGPPGCLRVELV
jgi:hypothetical protein